MSIMHECEFWIENEGDVLNISLSLCATEEESWLNGCSVYTITLARAAGTGKVSYKTLREIPLRIAEKVKDDPNIILLYLCDAEHATPSRKDDREEGMAEYRDRLFSALFLRCKRETGLKWKDHTMDTNTDGDSSVKTHTHIILHEQQSYLIEAITDKFKNEYTADK